MSEETKSQRIVKTACITLLAVVLITAMRYATSIEWNSGPFSGNQASSEIQTSPVNIDVFLSGRIDVDGKETNLSQLESLVDGYRKNGRMISPYYEDDSDEAIKQVKEMLAPLPSYLPRIAPK